MRIRMNTSLAGPFESWDQGQEYEVDEAFGRALCADGRAEPAASPPEANRRLRTEVAGQAVETAAVRPGRAPRAGMRARDGSR